MTPAWLREVFEQDDRNRAEVARWEAKRAQQAKKSEPELRSRAVMDAEAQAKWDQWIEARFEMERERWRGALDALADEAGGAVGTLERTLRIRLDVLETEIARLRVELNTMRGEHKAEVVDLPATWRARNAA
jgi:hypothetical protein